MMIVKTNIKLHIHTKQTLVKIMQEKMFETMPKEVEH